MSNFSYNPGDIKLNSVMLVNSTGKGIDIARICTQINLYESINSPFITGDVTVTDSVGLIEAMPMIGEEQIYLDIETPGNPSDKTLRRRGVFLAYKLGGVENLALKNRVFIIHFVSIEMLTDLNCKISRTYRGSLSGNVSKLITGQPGLNTSKQVEIDSSTNSHIFTANFWTPIETISYITRNAIGEGNNPSFVFFEDRDGFKFKTLDNLYKQPVSMSFSRDMKMRGIQEPESLEEEYSKVLDMSTQIHHDYIERLKSGFYAGSVLTFDIYSKVITNTERLAIQNWKTQTMNKSYPITENIQALPESNRRTQIHQRELYNGYNVLPLEHHLKRMHKISLLSASSTNIQVFGRLSYTVGQKINLTVYRDVDYNTKSRDSKDIIDEVLSGDYIITSINHNMTQTKHMCNIELSKESYVKEL